MKKETAEDIKKQLTRKTPKLAVSANDMVSTGCTLLNLACTGNPSGGFVKGKYYYLVGDSTSGKTWISLTCFAEAANNPSFKDYVFYYDNVEDGALMDMEFYFGAKAAARIRPPSRDENKTPVYSSTVESFYYHVDSAIKRAKEKNRPFIYVLDSQDSLTSDAANEKFDEQKKAFLKGNDSAGSYGDGKAKKHSENIRRVLIGLRETKSILIIIGQTRDNLGIGFDKKTRSGGKSLRFYATLELWSSVKEKIKKNVRGKPKTIGIMCQIAAKKNRITGKTDRAVAFPIYHSHGIDDVGGNVDYLVEQEHWSSSSKSIDAADFNFKGTRDALIAHIEQEGLEKDLSELVYDVWKDIEESCAINRKKRYE